MSLLCKGGGKFVERGTFVKKGTTIIESEPFAFVLSSKFRTERCDACFKSCKISRCAGCQYVYYCSRNCQKKSWSMHKVECPNIKRVYPREVPDAARILTRIIIKMQNGEGEERGYYSPHEYRTFEDLMSHYFDILKDMKRMEHFMTVSAVLNEFLPRSMLPEAKELVVMFGRMIINCFHILDLEMTSIGAGIYLGPSIIDHSCKPTAVTVFDGTTLIVRSLQDIPSFDWTKVSISYIYLLKSVEERREELQSSYYFHCCCDNCENPDVVTIAAACPNRACTNPCLPDDSKCNKCDHEFPADFTDDFETTKSFSLRHLEKMKDNANLEVCRMCLKQQEGLLHSLNFVHVRMLEMATIAATEAELWDESEMYGTKLVQKLEYYYGDAHPLTLDGYLNLGMVLGKLKKPKKAFDVIRKALDIVKLAFGEDHPKMNVVKQFAASFIVENETTIGD